MNNDKIPGCNTSLLRKSALFQSCFEEGEETKDTDPTALSVSPEGGEGSQRLNDEGGCGNDRKDGKDGIIT